jgi:hypothetical protein
LKIQINNTAYKIREGSVNISDAFGERSTSSFVLVTDSIDNIKFYKGQEVVIKDELETIIFKGVIDICKEKKLTEKKFHIVVAVDFHYLVEKRIVAKSFENMRAGKIARWIVDNILNAEGITYTQTSIMEGEIISKIRFNYIYCHNAFNKLVEKCGFIWYIDSDKVLHFHDPKIKFSDKTITNSMIRDNTLVIENKNQQYRNKQYIKGAKETTSLQKDVFHGDGETRNFVLGYPLEKKPVIYVNNEKIDSSDIVLKGYNDTAKFYYNKNDAVITQNNNQDPLTSADELKIEYYGQFPVIVITEDISEIEKRKCIEKNSGLVENVAFEPEMDNLDSVFQSANAKLKAYAKESITIKFQTCETWLHSEMIVSIDTEEIKEDNLLVQSIEYQDEFKLLWCNVTLVKGIINESWAKVFARALTAENSVVQEEMLKNETLVLLDTYSKEWTIDEEPNIFKELYPSDTLYPSETIYPMFTEDESIKYVEILDCNGKIIVRKYVTYRNRVNNELSISFFIAPFEGNTKWSKLRFYGGDLATDKFETGVLIDEVLNSRKKTQLESIQIKRTDIRGW